MRKTAILFGATGLTGSFLLTHLLASEDYDKVVAFTRRKLEQSHPKLINQLLPPEITEASFPALAGDTVFCCIGTTRKKAGSKAAFIAGDRDLVLLLAQKARQIGVGTFVVISSVGANPNSGNTYLKTKGQMEEGLKELNFQSLVIFRPSLLLGIRSEYRFGEDAAKWLSAKLPWIYSGPFKKYAPVHAADLAASMLKASLQYKGCQIIESVDI
jgi:uncharacterized protein YbjT (DUF2867 family)